MVIRAGDRLALKHGGSGTRIYRILGNMKTRCYNPRAPRYADYGARGITICDQWKNSFEAFRTWAVANGYEDGLMIDRINNDKGYSPENCRWVTPKQNNVNQRSNVRIEIAGRTLTVSEWAAEPICEVEASAVRRRLSLGWDPVAAVTTPKLPPKPRQKWAARHAE